MKILVLNESKSRVPQKFLLKWGELLSKELIRRKEVTADFKNKELTLVFLDPKPARKLNLEFRNKDYATDVLSFDSLTPESLGELVMCPEVLKRQANEHGLTQQMEWGYMVLHGVLHLLGYDHELGEKEEREMFQLQDDLFEVLLKKTKAAK